MNVGFLRTQNFGVYVAEQKPITLKYVLTKFTFLGGVLKAGEVSPL